MISFDFYFTQRALHGKMAWHRTIFLLYIRNMHMASEVAGEIHAVEHAHLSFMLFKVKICLTNFIQV